ncbi:MAG: hypothetical protein ACFFCZ_08495 [Promethearchaeota archaeon]
MYVEQPSLDGISINQIWMINNAGLCLFHTSFIEDIERSGSYSSLFPSFISAISTFATEIARSPLKKIILGNMVLYQYKKGRLMVCLSTESEIQDELVLHKFFERLVIEFENEFSTLIDSFGVNITAFEKFQSKLYEILNIKAIEKHITFAEKIPSFHLVFNALGKVVDRVINSVIIGEKIAVIGNQGDTTLLIVTLERFSPHNHLKSIYWTNIPFEDAHLIGIPKKLEQDYADQGYMILDIKNPAKFRGSTSKFVKKLVRDIINVDDLKSAEFLIKTRISYFITHVSTILDLYNREEITKEALEILKKDIDEDFLNLILGYIRNAINPNFELPREKGIWTELDDF